MSRADDLIERLQSRIVELEAELEESLVDWGTLRLELAALKAQPNVGVVMPEPLKRGDEGGSGEYGAAMIRGFNACLREVARLNPCRAQPVPDGYVMVPVEPTPAMRAAIMSGISHDHMVGNYKAMLAAALQAKP